MSNKFCRYLTNGIRVQYWGDKLAASPCCYTHPYTAFDNPAFDEKFNEYHQLDKCDRCFGYVAGDPTYYVRRSFADIEDCNHTHPVLAEISIDTKCNAACLTCNDSLSSYWAEQNIKFKIKTTDDYPDILPDEEVVRQVFDKFNFAYVKKLNLLGGEPMVSRANLLFLERLIELDFAKNIEVLITTNGSTHAVYRHIELLQQFKKITFTYSVDGVGERFQYLRYPLKWEKLQTVVETAKSIGASVNVNSTINPLNIFYINEIKQWVSDCFDDYDNFNDCYYPPTQGIMSLDALPIKARQDLLKQHSKDPIIRSLINSSRPSKTAIKNFLDHLDFWDQCRELDWKQVFPAAVPYYSDYYK